MPYRIDLALDAVAGAFYALPEHPVLNLAGGAAPGGPAWVVRIRAGRRVVTPMVWGFPPPPGREQLVASARNLDSTFWRPWLKTPYRCLIPFTSCIGPSGQRLQPVGVAPAAFAGLWRPFEEVLFFARLSVASDERTMPVVLTRPDEFSAWLEAPVAVAMAMQQPPGPGQLEPVF